MSAVNTGQLQIEPKTHSTKYPTYNVFCGYYSISNLNENKLSK